MGNLNDYSKIGRYSNLSWSIPEMTIANDYYPFGMLMPGRTLSTEDYRFGFNDKENLNDVKGLGKLQDYGMRIYDPRLGKFLSVDPLTKGYPWYSPYQFAGNKPTAAVDLDGLEEKIVTNSGFLIKATYSATLEVVNNVDIETLQQEVNTLLNGVLIYKDYPPNFIGAPELGPTVEFQIQIVAENASDNNMQDLSKSRIATANGQSLGGRIIMGKLDDPNFLNLDKDGKPTGNLTAAYHLGNTIYLNPVFYDQNSPEKIDVSKFEHDDYSSIAHEIGHDLGLNHPKGDYPSIGLMSNTFEKKPLPNEIKTIIDNGNKSILQPGERYMPEDK